MRSMSVNPSTTRQYLFFIPSLLIWTEVANRTAHKHIFPAIQSDSAPWIFLPKKTRKRAFSQALEPELLNKLTTLNIDVFPYTHW